MTSSTGRSSRRTGEKYQTYAPEGYSKGKIAQYTPEQYQLFQQMFGLVGPESYTARLAGGDESLFKEMEAPALKQFGQLQSGLATRYSGGGLGARKSTGFQNYAGQQAADFASQLQAQRQGLQRQAIQDLMGMSTSLLNQRPYEKFLVKEQEDISPLQRFVGGILPVAGAAAGGYASGGNPAGISAGYQAGQAASQGFFG